MSVFVNATPHAVTIQTTAGDRVFKSAGVIRLESAEQVELLRIDSIPIFTHPRFTALQDPAGLLEAPTVRVIVSMPVAQFLKEHGCAENPDLEVYSPDTGPSSVVRNDKGQIVAVRRLIRWV